MLKYRLWLSSRKGLRAEDYRHLLQHFGSPAEVYSAGRAFGFLRNDTLRKSLEDKDLEEAERILSDCREKEIEILTVEDSRYPHRLRNIPDAPIVLYCKGTVPNFDEEAAVAVVGTRRATQYGLRTAWSMGTQIAQCGGLVVSGGAAGIDTAAMQGAFQASGRVVGVLGCGVDVAYPKENEAFFHSLTARGCLISEYPPGAQPLSWHFPRRNRIISGLSKGVLVVEAPQSSGALKTAQLALDQNRDVFVVPGNIDAATFSGSNALLRQGAVAVGSGWDVMSEYCHLFPDKLRRPEDVSGYPPHFPERIPVEPAKPTEKRVRKGKNDKKDIDNPTLPPYSEANCSPSRLTSEEAQIVDALRSGECSVDTLTVRTGMDVGRLNSLLTLLQISGTVQRLPGNRVILKK